MKPLSIKELRELLNSIPTKYDDHIVLVSDDEEGNGYHPLFFKSAYRSDEKFNFYNEKTKSTEERETLTFN